MRKFKRLLLVLVVTLFTLQGIDYEDVQAGGSIASGSPAAAGSQHTYTGSSAQTGCLYNHQVVGFRVYFMSREDADTETIGTRKAKTYVPQYIGTEDCKTTHYYPIYALNRVAVPLTATGNSPLAVERITSLSYDMGDKSMYPFKNRYFGDFVLYDTSKGVYSGNRLGASFYSTVSEMRARDKFMLYTGGNELLDSMCDEASENFNTACYWQNGYFHQYFAHLCGAMQSGMTDAIWFKPEKASMLMTNWAATAEISEKLSRVMSITGCSSDIPRTGGEIFNQFVEEKGYTDAGRLSELMDFVCAQYGVSREEVYPGDITEYVLAFEPVFTIYTLDKADPDPQVRGKASLCSATEAAMYFADIPYVTKDEVLCYYANVVRDGAGSNRLFRSPVADNGFSYSGYTKTVRNILNALQPSDVAADTSFGGWAVIYTDLGSKVGAPGVYAEYDVNFYTDDTNGLTNVSYSSSGTPGYAIKTIDSYKKLASASHNKMVLGVIKTNNKDLQDMLVAPREAEENAFKFFQEWFYKKLTWEDYMFELICNPNYASESYTNLLANYMLATDGAQDLKMFQIETEIFKELEWKGIKFQLENLELQDSVKYLCSESFTDSVNWYKKTDGSVTELPKESPTRCKLSDGTYVTCQPDEKVYEVVLPATVNINITYQNTSVPRISVFNTPPVNPKDFTEPNPDAQESFPPDSDYITTSAYVTALGAYGKIDKNTKAHQMTDVPDASGTVQNVYFGMDEKGVLITKQEANFPAVMNNGGGGSECAFIKFIPWQNDNTKLTHDEFVSGVSSVVAEVASNVTPEMPEDVVEGYLYEAIKNKFNISDDKITQSGTGTSASLESGIHTYQVGNDLFIVADYDEEDEDSSPVVVAAIPIYKTSIYQFLPE